MRTRRMGSFHTNMMAEACVCACVRAHGRMCVCVCIGPRITCVCTAVERMNKSWDQQITQILSTLEESILDTRHSYKRTFLHWTWKENTWALKSKDKFMVGRDLFRQASRTSSWDSYFPAAFCDCSVRECAQGPNHSVGSLTDSDVLLRSSCRVSSVIQNQIEHTGWRFPKSLWWSSWWGNHNLPFSCHRKSPDGQSQQENSWLPLYFTETALLTEQH